MTPATKRGLGNLVLGSASLGIVWCVLGFWFHTSSRPVVFGKYSTEYFAFAVVVTLLGLCGVMYLRVLLSESHIVLSGGRRIAVPVRWKLIITVTICLSAFGLAETVLAMKQQRLRRNDRSQFHPYLQSVPKPDDASFNINRWGFRGEDIELQKPSDTFRIFVLGGSTVLSADIPFEDSHFRVLELELRKVFPHLRIEVQNAGMDGHTSQHSLMKLLFKIENFDPDLIIAWHGVNDLSRSFSPPILARPGYEIDYGHYYGSVGEMVNAHFNNNPHRLFVIEKVSNAWASNWFPDFSTSKVAVVPVSEWRSLPEFERNIRNLVAIAQTKRIQLVLASEAYLYKTSMNSDELSRLWLPDFSCRNQDHKPDISSMIEGMQAFNRVSRQIAQENGVLFVDLEATVPKTLEYFRDDVHYTRRGSRLVGETLAKNMIGSEVGNEMRQRGDSSADE